MQRAPKRNEKVFQASISSCKVAVSLREGKFPPDFAQKTHFLETWILRLPALSHLNILSPPSNPSIRRPFILDPLYKTMMSTCPKLTIMLQKAPKNQPNYPGDPATHQSLGEKKNDIDLIVIHTTAPPPSSPSSPSICKVPLTRQLC